MISRDFLLDAFANRRFVPFDRSVDVLVGKLRQKIEPNPKQPRLIVTVPGEGYRFDALRFRPPQIVKLDADTAAKARSPPPPPLHGRPALLQPRRRSGARIFCRRRNRKSDNRLSRISGAFVIARNTAFAYKGKAGRCDANRARTQRPLRARRQRAARRWSACASTCSSSKPRLARICGPSASTSPSLISSTCRTRSSRVLQVP